MLRLLLDTHVWLCAVTRPERLGEEARRVLADENNTLLLSAASSWEIAIKYALGKLPLPEPPESFVPPRLVRDGITPIAVDHTHALRVAALPPHHKDPFDRLLVAQAQLLDVPLVTADPLLDPYDIERIRAW